MLKMTSAELNCVQLLRNDVLIKLPDYTKTNVRKTASGIELATLEQEKYNPTHGEITRKGGKAGQVQAGDTVFFHYLSYTSGMIRSDGSVPNSKEDKRHDNYHENISTAYIEVGESPYLIMPENELYFVIRNGEIVMLNDNYLLEPILLELEKQGVMLPHGKSVEHTFVKTKSNILQLHNDKVRFEKNIAVVYCKPENSPIETGIVVHMLDNCYIKPEYEYNHPMLKKELFIVNKKNIIAIDKPGSIPSIQPIKL